MPMPEIKYQPGDRVCFIKDRMIIMARVSVTFYDTESKTFKFLLDKFAREFTEDELFFNFHDANGFLGKGKINRDKPKRGVGGQIQKQEL